MIQRRFTLWSLALGAGIGLALWRLWLPFPDALMAGWCAHVLLHGLWCWRVLGCAEPDTMRARAQALQDGRWTVLAVALVATALAAGIVVEELALNKEAPGWERALAVAAILLSWGHVHLLFAQDYAHEYWRGDTGFEFPGGDGTPEFSEFLYVALAVGMTAQISDTPTNSPRTRRIVAAHAVVSFVFNAAILATGVNVLAR